MLEGGDDPLYIARRLIRFASEDIGMADPNALPLTIAARDAYHMLGSPEELARTTVIYLATAPRVTPFTSHIKMPGRYGNMDIFRTSHPQRSH